MSSPAESVDSFTTAVSDMGTSADALNVPEKQASGEAGLVPPMTTVPEAVPETVPEAVQPTDVTAVVETKSTVQSARELCVAPELVAKWEEEMGFSPEQQAAMETFRKTLVDEGLMQDWLNNKPMWFRFCQARGWEVAKALTMCRDSLVWRKANGLEDFVQTEHGLAPRFVIDFVYPELPEIKKAYNFNHHKMDKSGMPVYFDRMGDLSYPQMISAQGSTPERVLQYFTWYAEASWQYRLPAASLAAGKYIGKGMYVMDLQGFALSKHFTKETRSFIQAFIKVASDNYPETIYKTYIINAPFVFRTAWAFVGGFLDARQKAKFSIMGGQKEYLPKLLEVMDIKDIPVQFGGEDESCSFYEEQGPWQSIMPSPAGPRQA